MDVSSVAAFATNLSAQQLSSKVSTAVARKTLDAAETQGAALIAMIESAGSVGEPGKGANLDVKA